MPSTQLGYQTLLMGCEVGAPWNEEVDEIWSF